MAWLTNRVWLEQDDRHQRLEAAINIARQDPPHLEHGNILTDLRKHIGIAAPYGQALAWTHGHGSSMT